MPTIRFLGQVIPSALKINFSGIRPFISQEIATKEIMTLTVSIAESRITVDCAMDSYKVGDDISIPHTRATHVARALLDCFAFAHGHGLIVFLDEVEDADGITKKILLDYPELQRKFTAFRNDDGSVDMNGIYQIVLADPDLSLAINDLILAIAVPGNIAINCARSVEALRNIFAPGAENRKPGWAKLREALHLEKSYTEFITESSTAPRHGAERYLPTRDIHKEVLNRTWIIMDRFLHYRKRGDQPLPVNEFPVLS